LDRKLKVYVKKNTPPTAVFDLSFWGRAPNEDDGREPPAARPVASVAQMADRKVIDKYAPPGVIVDDRLDVMQFRGKPGPFLEPAPGAATLSLLKLVRPELLVALRTTAHASLTEGVAVSSPPIQMRGDRGPREVTLDVIPLPNSAGRKCLVILFNEATPRPQLPEAHANRPEPSEVDPRITGLERELAVNKEYLQSTVEELEAANEELQSSNEELQSSNEELQSTNEELETSKEELQSTNEELATVNDELQNRMAQLSIANDDLHNVLLNGTSAIVIVGADLRLRRFSSMAEKLLSLIPGDVGRPIAYLRNVMSARDVEQVASEALSSITVREQRVRCIDGSWYFLKIIPYVTADHMIRGLVLEFVRTAPPSATADVEPLHPLAKHVLSVLPQPLMLLDRQLRLVWANRAFFEAFSVGPAALGRPLSEAWGSTTEPADLWVFLEELSAGRSPRDLVIEHPFGRVSGRPMCLSGRIVPSEGDHPALSLVFMQEA
jgi:two-component system CheB/CheR fusion protein